MTVTGGSRSRASSARGGSIARDITRQRDKPYKTEQSRIFAKKRKLTLNTTAQDAPPEFHFLPVGTPDLAERCKEISRQRSLPVNVVNAKTHNRFARDPSKVSHHVHRIGYHFRSEVVDQASRELGYVYSRGAFVKEQELAEQDAQSKIAKAMAKFGLHPNEALRQESDDQVRAAIKELFPKIPETDLKEILRHAWEKGAQRVGTARDMDLPRRVQLATIARIRHMYTDYDRLLRAFEWSKAREIVEPDCLAKLIEWRGEDDENDDDEIEEIVRETIIIDDDDDDAPIDGSEADDEGSADSGDTSDTSIEIIHRPAGEADFAAESFDEGSRKFLQRFQPVPRINQQREIGLNQKISAIREQRRCQAFLKPPTAEVIQIDVPENVNGTFAFNGQFFQRAPRTTLYPESRLPTSGVDQIPQRPFQQHQIAPAYLPQPERADSSDLQNRPVASIESYEDIRQTTAASLPGQTEQAQNSSQSWPATPRSARSDKRRRLDYPVPLQDHAVVNHGLQHHTPVERHVIPSSTRYNFSHGSSLELAASPLHPHGRSDAMDDRNRTGSERELLLVARSDGSAVSNQEYIRSNPTTLPHGTQYSKVVVKDRGIPFSNMSPDERNRRPWFADAQVAPIQYMPLPQQHTASMRPLDSVRNFQRSANGYEQPRVVYMQPSHEYSTLQPAHGQPASVQQIPRAPDKQPRGPSSGNLATGLIEHPESTRVRPMIHTPYYQSSYPR